MIPHLKQEDSKVNKTSTYKKNEISARVLDVAEVRQKLRNSLGFHGLKFSVK